ncbi:ferrous iron transport protein B [Parasporobacterium paucivorans]|uniref:Ferrous iron transport protein B n=1 Tax=Parasporobacterium paucivorans DSM 15970 TaxID=1122934 RepID=A0A1M6DNH9_9FIRM|nr:ferrous iron transport protein B [Parasporobacterium paucivorans]SHI74824.1 ferrous iron transport protein B [Parasporobacterium paucivorans DSM 15970]
MAITIALAGNPNSGKTTLFNELTGSKQHVGNWPGVTVDKKEGKYKKDENVLILDLPGTYSLSPYSAEEIIARDYLLKEKPDAVINIIDGSNIERNLYLTLQIAETKIPMLVAVNMMDEVRANGDRIDFARLYEETGIRFLPIVARSYEGVDELMKEALKIAGEQKKVADLPVLDETIKEAADRLTQVLGLQDDESRLWKVLKVLEGDKEALGELSREQIVQAKNIIEETENKVGTDMEARLADLHYKYIGYLAASAVTKKREEHAETRSQRIDKVLTNKYLALPVFAVIMYLLFAITFSENFLFIHGLPSPGIWMSGLVETAWTSLTALISSGLGAAGASAWVFSLVIDGIMAGIGAVAGFLPLVLVLFVLLSFLEDSGYMSRVAFVMDRIFRKLGLSGRSFIPLLMGFGCSVPAIMATRTLESERDRRITMMIIPFMSCGAKLPVYAMFAAMLFEGYNKTLIVFSMYILGLIVAVISATILDKFFFKTGESNFIMEMPQYRLPTLKSIGIHAWDKIKDFAIKAGTVIFVSTVFIWILANFNFSGMCDMEDSFLASIGNVIRIVFIPLGFGDWRAAVGIITGWIAKENIVATLGQLLGSQQEMKSVFTMVSAYAYMAFNLLCMPCFAAVGALRKEMGSWKWTLRAIAFQMITAYIVALIINVVGNLIF